MPARDQDVLVGPEDLRWPHAPTHRLSESGCYIVTAGTYFKQHHFRSRERLDYLLLSLVREAERFGWLLEAWAVFSNHYHFVAQSPSGVDGAASLSAMLGHLHEHTAKWVNTMDGAVVVESGSITGKPASHSSVPISPA